MMWGGELLLVFEKAELFGWKFKIINMDDFYPVK